MSKSLAFWLVFIVWIIAYVLLSWPVTRRDARDVLLAILLALLGWATFGAMVD